MPLRTYKPTSPGLRQMTRSTFEEITTKEPHKPLLEPQKRGSGRNNQGRLTVRRPDGSVAYAGTLTVTGYRAGWAKRRGIWKARL